MCGIVGIYSKKIFYNKDNIQDMLNTIEHRGPDDQGIKIFNNDKYFLSIGHKRLSIIDLSKNAHQPMDTYDKKLSIVYNGEIYNFKEIKKELEKKGYIFKSDSDTEVVLYAYQEYGYDCIKHFKGFFAFCIYDKNKNNLFLARDRIGQKPLKYYYDGDTFAFSSEIKSFYPIKEIKKYINTDAIEKFLLLRYIPAPLTIFKNTYKLPAGAYMIFSLSSQRIEKKTYWKPKFYPKININYYDAKEKTKTLLKKSISYRMISDVPVGLFLSGGIDSSTIVALLRDNNPALNIKTFSVGFNESKFDERKYAKIVSDTFKTKHTEFIVEPNFENDLEMLICNYDEPFADPSLIPTFYLNKEVAKEVKVVLSGDGADEILGGYKRYNIHLRNKFLDYIPKYLTKYFNNFLSEIPICYDKNKKYGKIAKLLESISGSFTDTYYLRLSSFTKNIEKDILLHNNSIDKSIWSNKINEELDSQKLSYIERLFLIDQMTHLPEYIFTKSDISSMTNSIECRSPFMDNEFIDYINRLDISYKHNKKILKDILIDEGLPKEFVYRKKAGFNPPMRMWFKEHNNFIKNLLFKNGVVFNYLDKNKVLEIYHQNKYNDYKLSNMLWVLLVLSIWFKHNEKYIEEGK